MADERTTDVNLNVNEEIQDRTIRHMVFLERYKISEIRRIRNKLDREIIPGITENLRRRLDSIVERGSDLGPVTTRRLEQLERELQRLSDRMTRETKALLTIDLDDFTADEMAWQVNAIKDSLGFDLELIVPSATSVSRITKRTSFAGQTLDRWFETVSRANQRQIMTAVNRGIVEGETTDQIIRRIRGTRRLNYTDGVYQATRRQVETVTRSTVNHASNQARLELFKRNEDILKGLQWTSTLDSRTSSICAGLDGKIFPLDKGPRPPAHPNCRSTMTAVLKSAEEIGLNKIPEGKRASMNGQVPASTTYGQWLKKQPVSIQEDVLGVTKAKLFRQGKLPIERFTDARLKPLTLEQLRQTEKKAFDRAGL